MTHPIFQNIAEGMMAAQRLQSPGLEPPQPVGCPNCAQAEAEVDRLKSALDQSHAMLAHIDQENDRLEAENRMLNASRDDWKGAAERAEAALDLEAKSRVAAAEMAHEAKLAQGQAEDDRNAMLFLLAKIREACGDNGRRMQNELIDYIRLLWEEADPDRVSQREAELRAHDYAPAQDPNDAGAWGEDRFEAAS